MIKLQSWGVGLLALGLLAACGEAGYDAASEDVGGELAEFSSEQADTTSESDVEGALIDEVTFEDTSYTFIDMGDSVAISVAGTVAHGEPALHRLQREYGALTSLEVYLAFAGDDAVPDERLVEAHGQEAEAFGRADDAIVRVDVGSLGPVEKKTLTDCKSIVATAAFNAGNPSPIVWGATYSAAASTDTPLTTRAVAGAVCNDAVSSGGTMLAYFYERRDGSSYWRLIRRYSVSIGNYIYLAGFPQSYRRSLRTKATHLGATHPYHLTKAY